MATKRIPILHLAVPDTTGDAFFEPYTNLATNDKFGHLVLRMGANNAAQPTLKAGVYGVFNVPKDFVSAPVIIPVWTATLTSGDVRFALDYRAIGGDDTESLDQATYQESLTLTDTAPGAAHRKMEPTGFALTAGNLAIDDLLEFLFTRDGANAADTMAGSALVHALVFQYSDV
jgi:hypothetical protein